MNPSPGGSSSNHAARYRSAACRQFKSLPSTAMTRSFQARAPSVWPPRVQEMPKKTKFVPNSNKSYHHDAGGMASPPRASTSTSVSTMISPASSSRS